MKKNIYVGTRSRDRGASIQVNGKPLDLRLDLRDHSPTGFEWGYNGSGPAQTALAILAHEYGDEFALNHYQTFKRIFVATLTRESPGSWRASSTILDQIALALAE